jgi:hypothetical protein
LFLPKIPLTTYHKSLIKFSWKNRGSLKKERKKKRKKRKEKEASAPPSPSAERRALRDKRKQAPAEQ